MAKKTIVFLVSVVVFACLAVLVYAANNTSQTLTNGTSVTNAEVTNVQACGQYCGNDCKGDCESCEGCDGNCEDCDMPCKDQGGRCGIHDGISGRCGGHDGISGRCGAHGCGI